MRRPLLISACLLAVASWAMGQQADPWIWPPGPAGSDTIYSPPGSPALSAAAPAEERVAALELGAGFSTDSVYRGISRTGDHAPPGADGGSNYQFDGRLTLQPDAVVRPFVAAFANLNDADSVSTLQELRLSGGAEWRLGNTTLSAGLTAYIFPGRPGRNTNEVFARADFGDQQLWRAAGPVLSPHLLLAWDPDANDGGYAELGIEHEWRTPVPELSLLTSAALAYTQHLRESFIRVEDGTGWQHLEVELQARYRLNALLNIPRASGDWSLCAYLARAEHLDRHTLGEDVTWGGCRLAWTR